MTLSARQEKFTINYARTGNATQAYKDAGYKAKNDNVAAAGASGLLKLDKVKARLKELRDEMASESIANASEIQEKLTRILRGEDREERPYTDDLGQMQVMRVINQNNQIKSAELLAKMQGVYDGGAKVNIVVPVIAGEAALED